MTAPADERPGLSATWEDLRQAGKVPDKGEGATAERAERDKKRQRQRMPTEDRRQGQKISPTLPVELIERLREICKTEGYTGQDDEGIVASPVIEDLLRFAVEAYEEGRLAPVEEVVEVRRRLRPSPAPE